MLEITVPAQEVWDDEKEEFVFSSAFKEWHLQLEHSLAVISLVSEEIRNKQLAGEIQQPYQKIVTYETTEYDDLTIEKAYEYLKTLPEFEGAEDILEEKHILS